MHAVGLTPRWIRIESCFCRYGQSIPCHGEEISAYSITSRSMAHRSDVQGFHAIKTSFPCFLEGSEAHFLRAVSEIQVDALCRSLAHNTGCLPRQTSVYGVALRQNGRSPVQCAWSSSTRESLTPQDSRLA